MKCHLWWCDVHREGWRLRSSTDKHRRSLAKNMYSSLNIEGLHKEEHGVLCAACHYYTHVSWCKLIGWIALFFCTLIKGNGIPCSFCAGVFLSVWSKRHRTLDRSLLSLCFPLICSLYYWRRHTSSYLLLVLDCLIFYQISLNALEKVNRREQKATDRIHSTIKFPQFTEQDIVFYFIHMNLPLGNFTSLKSCTICRASSKGILVFAVAY